MSVSGHDRLRALLGESIPPGGAESDTLFTNGQIDDLLTRHLTVEASLMEGWQLKAAAVSTLVDTAEGASKENLSQLHGHALAMMKTYTPLASVGGITPPTPVTRVKKIAREGYREP